MFSYDPTKRPTVDEIRSHAWMTKGGDFKESRKRILDQVQEKRTASTNTSSKDDMVRRGAKDLELVRQCTVGNLNRYTFNDNSDFDITIVPGAFWDQLNSWNEDINDSKAKFEKNVEKQYIMMSQPDEEA